MTKKMLKRLRLKENSVSKMKTRMTKMQTTRIKKMMEIRRKISPERITSTKRPMMMSLLMLVIKSEEEVAEDEIVEVQYVEEEDTINHCIQMQCIHSMMTETDI